MVLFLYNENHAIHLHQVVAFWGIVSKTIIALPIFKAINCIGVAVLFHLYLQKTFFQKAVLSRQMQKYYSENIDIVPQMWYNTKKEGQRH